MDSLLRTVALGTASIDRSKITWHVPLISSIVIAVLVAACLQTGHMASSVPVAIGALFVPLAGIAQGPGRRVLTQLWTLLWLMVGAFVGQSLSELPVVLMAVLAGGYAFLCGFVGGAGPAARLAGVLSLVVFAVFMGLPASPLTALESALLMGLGGVIQGVVLLLARRLLRHGEDWRFAGEPQSLLERLRPRWNARDDYLRHGVRLALAFGTATALGQWLQWPHEFWIPMTVAWIALPDATGTATRVVARVVGTLAGVLVAAVLVEWSGVGPTGVAVLVGLGALIALMFIGANYGIAVVGVTLFVIAVFSLLDDPLTQSLEFRGIDTVIAGVLTLAFSLVWPSVSHEPRALWGSSTRT